MRAGERHPRADDVRDDVQVLGTLGDVGGGDASPPADAEEVLGLRRIGSIHGSAGAIRSTAAPAPGSR